MFQLALKQARAFGRSRVSEGRDHGTDSDSDFEHAFAHQLRDYFMRSVGVDFEFLAKRADGRKGIARAQAAGDDGALRCIHDLLVKRYAGPERQPEWNHRCIIMPGTREKQARANAILRYVGVNSIMFRFRIFVAAASCLAFLTLLWGADETLTFQTHQPWSARINLEADVAMNYGIDPSLPQRMETWRQHGYRTEVMTGVAWGEYQDYLNGAFDGKKHWDEAQTESSGKVISHGKDMPYMAPGIEYGRYLTVGVKRALDAGAQAIYLEEPEFWARAGWSESFKREWKAYYGEDWQAPDSSPDAQYRASKLKYFLYRRALQQVFTFVRGYGNAHGHAIPCYVPTHSLINYADWRIVSPESSLIDVGADGYIAQVWTGTARTPNAYEGRTKERTFETAYLEYGAMQNLVRASGRRVWYLNDPIEDNPNHTWADYRTNWESTLTASLLQPQVSRYEIMPWPERIFYGKRPAAKRTAAGQLQRVSIPAHYATELQTVIHALGEMKQPPESVRWEKCGTQKIGVLVSDTMMFERAAPDASDPNLGSFFGLAMPLLKRGVPVEPVQIESASKPGFLSRYRILLLTYEGQKPPAAEFHVALASWVRNGGALLVVDNDRDPYNRVREWWNRVPLHYRTPREHLFEQLGLKGKETGLHRVGTGFVVWAQRISRRFNVPGGWGECGPAAGGTGRQSGAPRMEGKRCAGAAARAVCHRGRFG